VRIEGNLGGWRQRTEAATRRARGEARGREGESISRPRAHQDCGDKEISGERGSQQVDERKRRRSVGIEFGIQREYR